MLQRYRFPDSFPDFCRMAQIYISAGSNLGNRIGFLKSGIDAIAQNVGRVLKVSSVVETEAMGFSGHPFLNICFCVNTQLPPEEVMQLLLHIEEANGRKRSNVEGYKNRTLDLDLLFYDDIILQTPMLRLPHPELENRRFVVQPLAEIAPKKKHPVLGKSVSVLLKNCTDCSVLTIYEQQLHYKNRN